MVGPLEQVRVDAERDRRVGVPELARDEDDVQPLGDQERGEAVPKRVQREPSGRLQAAAFDGIAEAVADVPVVESADKPEPFWLFPKDADPNAVSTLGDARYEHAIVADRRARELGR